MKRTIIIIIGITGLIAAACTGALLAYVADWLGDNLITGGE